MNFHFHHFDTIGSTNDEAKRLAELGEPEGTAVTAETQTAGRGRSGRVWVTPHGASIAMSLILRPQLSGLHTIQVGLLGGLAVLEGIQRIAGLPVELKWPNDVLVDGKKVSGVLAEAAYNGDRLDYIVLGMGVNVNAGPPPDLQVEYQTTSLAEELGRELDRDALMRSILAAFAMRYPTLGTPALAEAWSERLAMRGQPVRVVGITETISGILQGVNGDGSLLVRAESGEIRTILTGDVHLRGV